MVVKSRVANERNKRLHFLSSLFRITSVRTLSLECFHHHLRAIATAAQRETFPFEKFARLFFQEWP